MTRRILLATMTAFGLILSTPVAYAGVCERGYVAEIIDAARDTAPSGAGYPRVLFRTDQTGFTPLDPGLKKAEVNGKQYSVLALARGADELERLAFEFKLQALKGAFLARTPIRVYSFNDNDCKIEAGKMEVLVCTSETACDL